MIVGNIVEQGPNSANSNLLGYGLEGLTNPAPHALYVAHNTFVNKKPTGSFIQLANGTDSLYLCNNIPAGAHTGGYLLGTPDVLDSTGNMLADLVTDPGFVDPAVYDYHLQAGSSARDHSSPLNKVVLGHHWMRLWSMWINAIIRFVHRTVFRTRALSSTTAP